MKTVRALIAMVACLFVFVACPSISTEPVLIYICPVDNDTLQVPGDTSGIVCADWDDSLSLSFPRR